MKTLLLKTNGIFEEIELKPKKYLYQSMADAIGAELVEIVQPKFLDDQYCIVCDECGLLKPNHQINIAASLLYGYQEHDCPIVGDIIIMKNVFTDDGIDTVGLDDADIVELKAMLINSYGDMIKEYINFMEKLINRKVKQHD